MKVNLFIISLLCMLLLGGRVEAKKHILYVGTYTNGTANGIFVYSFNDQTGKLTDLKRPALSNNPSFLAIAPNKKFLYAVGELDNLDSNQSGGLSAFAIGSDNRLTFLNHVLTHGSNPCHVSLSPDGKKLVASNYSAGNLSFFNILPDGRLSDMVQLVQHSGFGPDTLRQKGPHAHSAQFDATGKLLFAADLGIDELKIYAVGAGEQMVVPHDFPWVKLPAGSGPRHFCFSSDGRFIYLINEINSTIAVLMKYGGEWKQLQVINTLPADFKGENSCADIHISDDGRFVYGSNRGHNSIAVFSREQHNGKLKMVETVPVEGDWPRNFAIDPSGRFILVANQKSSDITVFKIDPLSGKLTFTGAKVKNPSPVCVKFLK